MYNNVNTLLTPSVHFNFPLEKKNYVLNKRSIRAFSNKTYCNVYAIEFSQI